MKINNNTLSLFKELYRRGYVLTRILLGKSEIYEAEKLVKAGVVSKGPFSGGLRLLLGGYQHKYDYNF